MQAGLDGVRDLADTAQVIAGREAVISVDTAVAHLAAAMGKPVLLMNRYDSCWRWPPGRTESAWYPTLRIVRQPCPGDWRTVVAEVRHQSEAGWPRTASIVETASRAPGL